jgi:hypothetical protein
MEDQLLLGARGLPNAYTTITTAYAAAGGSHADKMVALEPTLIAVGLLDKAAFA